ncbi:hypothetical protein [Streptomyces soliscabiei]|uniref:hypothetical protein n=1 Tax=Streptomyces soliscabiei TaxID=588897 RepID=UPI0029B67132|nr:hypothetical protein [Streptomyces sp. NY05-11A]MDX2678128.1 hypothetical protein [Streptomyces sp. NY05-11A]
MSALRTCAVVLAAGSLLAGGTAVAAQPDKPAAVAAAQPVAPIGGIVHMLSPLDLQSTASGAWTDSTLEVKLPLGGVYDLDVDVHGVLSGIPPVNITMQARLWDVTSGAPVPQSERFIDQVQDENQGNAQVGHNVTAPITERVRVTRPTTIRLQAARAYRGTAVVAQIRSDPSGYTAFRYEWVGP